jgi:hypothetical protein
MKRMGDRDRRGSGGIDGVWGGRWHVDDARPGGHVAGHEGNHLENGGDGGWGRGAVACDLRP